MVGKEMGLQEEMECGEGRVRTAFGAHLPQLLLGLGEGCLLLLQLGQGGVHADALGLHHPVQTPVQLGETGRASRGAPRSWLCAPRSLPPSLAPHSPP